MSLTTCSKGHCWGASLDNGWCNKHVDERIAQLEAENAKLKGVLVRIKLADDDEYDIYDAMDWAKAALVEVKGK